MSNPHTHRSQSTALARRLPRVLRRRLGFEAMEGRCLLSAATLQFTAFSQPEIQETTQVSLTALIGGQQASLNGEGGYINLGGLQSQSMNDEVTIVTAGAGGAGIGVLFNGAGSAGLLGNGQYAIPTVDSTLSLHTSFESFGSGFGTGFGLKPVVISPSIRVSDAMPRAADPGGSLMHSQDGGGHEGGIVQIDKILDGDERLDSSQVAKTISADDTPDQTAAHDNAPVVGTRSLALPADSDHAEKAGLASIGSTELAVSLDQRAADLTPAARRDVISGELARAMVFEMAGGEPAWIRPVETNAKVKGVAPVGRHDAPRADAPPLAPAAAQQAALRMPGSRIRLNGDAVGFAWPADEWTGWNSAPRSTISSQQIGGENSTRGDAFATFNVPGAVAAEVFKRLGHSQQPPVRSSLEEDGRSGPLVAGSVLALLMLERAAARYRSRSDRQCLTVVAGPPRI